MLPRPLALHQAPCLGDRCEPGHCVEDIERLVMSVIHAHIRGGTRNTDGMQGGGGWLTRDLEDELRAYLIGEVWLASSRFDGRGRLAGWCVSTAHRRVVDFLRKELGSARYGQVRPQPIELNLEAHDTAATWDEYPHEQNGRLIDVEALSPKARFAFENVVKPITEHDETETGISRRMGVPTSRVTKAFTVVRGELEAQGLVARR
jgi:DNA-directed RNA polymerase specialized sigma24 family protein